MRSWPQGPYDGRTAHSELISSERPPRNAPGPAYASSDRRPLTVGELTRRVRRLLEDRFFDVLVEGEVSGFRPSSTGHYYFNLVDREATLSVALFKNRHHLLSFLPADGMLVRVRGAISVYGKRGSYQLIAETIERAGEGNLLAILERRKRALAAQGLFAQDRKRRLPLLPRRVALVTSPTGAAVRDVLRVLGRRNAGVDLVILPTPVQGPEAAARIAKCIRAADRWQLGDVIIVTRGGGSLEDLLPFSDAAVVHAIAEVATPVISAVGHEVDTALSDLAADYRAPTPSAAAEVVAASRGELRRRVAALQSDLGRTMEARAQRHRALLDRFGPEQLTRSMRLLAHPARQRLDEARATLRNEIIGHARKLQHRFELAAQSIAVASPRAVLERGFALVTAAADGSFVTAAQQVRRGEQVRVQFHRSALHATVTETEIATEESARSLRDTVDDENDARGRERRPLFPDTSSNGNL